MACPTPIVYLCQCLKEVQEVVQWHQEKAEILEELQLMQPL